MILLIQIGYAQPVVSPGPAGELVSAGVVSISETSLARAVQSGPTARLPDTLLVF